MRLFHPTHEISEYQAELLVAAQEDEGAMRRIQELERRGAILESGAERIYSRGMKMQNEYEGEVHQLRGLLSSAEDRLRNAHENSEYAHSIAQRSHSDGREMQTNFENSLMEYRGQSKLATLSSSSLGNCQSTR